MPLASGKRATKLAVFEAVDRIRRPSGVYRLENRFRTLVATAPGNGGQ